MSGEEKREKEREREDTLRPWCLFKTRPQKVEVGREEDKSGYQWRKKDTKTARNHLASWNNPAGDLVSLRVTINHV